MSKDTNYYHNLGQEDGAKNESSYVLPGDDRDSYKEGWCHGKGQFDYNNDRGINRDLMEDKEAYDAGYQNANRSDSGK